MKTEGMSAAATVIVGCPNCKARYKVNSTAAIGHRVTCKACGNKFVAQPEATSGATAFPLPKGLLTPRALTAEELTTVRKRITAYSVDMPHLAIDALGDSIDIIDNELIPIYEITVKSLYECRKFEERVIPFTGQDIPALQTTAENVDCWIYDLHKRTAFEDFQDDHPVTDSQIVHDCEDCGASGQVLCLECEGHGKVTCPTCHGVTAVGCPQCRGSGQIRQERRIPVEKRCWVCGGSGEPVMLAKSMNYKVCQKCFGRGFFLDHEVEHFYIPCGYCGTTGQVRCTPCDASGTVTCSTCQAVGTIVCPRCDGRRQVISFLCVVRTMQPINQKATVVNGTVLQHADELLEESLDRCGDFVTAERAEEVLVPLSLDPLPNANLIEPLGRAVRQLLTWAMLQASRRRRIVRQIVDVKQTVSVAVRYSYEGKQYVARTLGAQAILLSDRTPLTDKATSLLEAALMAWQQGDKSGAVTMYRHCRDVAAKDERFKATMEEPARSIPIAMKTAVIASAAVVSAKAAVLRGVTKASEAVDVLKNSKIGRWFAKPKDSDKSGG